MNQTNVLLKSNFIAKKSQNPTKSRIINSNAENLLNTVLYSKTTYKSAYARVFALLLRVFQSFSEGKIPKILLILADWKDVKVFKKYVENDMNTLNTFCWINFELCQRI